MLTKRLLSGWCPMIATLMIAPAIAADPPAPKEASKQEASPSPEEASRQLEALLTERRDTLRQLVEALESGQRSGRGVTPLSVLRARNALLDAELDLAKTRDERVAVRQKMVANRKEIEELAEAQYRVGTATPDTFLRAKAARLKAEAQLLREKTGSGQ